MPQSKRCAPPPPRRLHAVLFTLLLFLLTAAAAHAQTVQGIVRDAERGLIIPGARLTLLNAAGVAVDSTRSDRAGRYRLRSPAAGGHTVHFQLDGWASILSETVQLNTGDTTAFEFRVRLVPVAALRRMSDIMSMEARLRESLNELCGEPYRAWEAGLLIGVVRGRASREPVAGARVSIVHADSTLARSTMSSDNGVYVLCNVPVGAAIDVTVVTPAGTRETTPVEIRAGTASWYDLHIGPRRR